MADATNPFDAIDPAGRTGPNPFDQFDEGPSEKYMPPRTSALGAGARHAIGGVAPAAGGIAAAAAGAELGGLAGAGLGGVVAGPPGALVGAPIGGFIGAIGGMFGGAYAVDEAQDWVLKQLPDSWVDALGQSDRQKRLDESQHPVASFVGGLVPYMATMRPSLSFKAAELPVNPTMMQRLLADPVGSRVFAGGIMGGFEVGQELAQGEFDWRKAAIATGFGMVFNKPTRLGQKLEEMGAAPLRIPAEALQRYAGPSIRGGEWAAFPEAVREGPTVAEAAARGVMGPGVTEEVYMGTQRQDPTAQMLSNEIFRQENAVLYGPELPDPMVEARRAEPELFERYERLKQQRDELDQWLREPLQEQLTELGQREVQLREQLDGVYPASPAGRRLRAMLRDIDNQREALLDRRREFLMGTAEETERAAEIRRNRMAIDEEMRDMAPQVSAALRRAEERVNQARPSPLAELRQQEIDIERRLAAGDVTNLEVRQANEELADIRKKIAALQGPAVRQPTEAQAMPSAAAGAQERNLAEQKAFIAAHVAQQLVAAGRPAEEAAAAGKLVAEKYATRAGLFKGKLGSAQQLYEREGAIIQGAGGAAPAAAPPATPAAAEATPAAVAPTTAETAAAPPAAAPAKSALPEKYQDWKVGDTKELGFFKQLRVAEVLPDGFIVETNAGQRFKFTPPETEPKPNKSGTEWLQYLEPVEKPMEKAAEVAPPAAAAEEPGIQPTTRPLEESLAEFNQLREQAATEAAPSATPPADFQPTPEELAQAQRVSIGWDPQKKLKQPKSLVQMVRRAGGLRPDTPEAGDLRSADLGKVPGLIAKEGRGVGITQLAEMARDNGFRLYQEEATGSGINEGKFLEALIEDASGTRKHYPEEGSGQAWAEQQAYFQEFWRYIDELGLKPKGMDPRTLAWILRQRPETARLLSLLQRVEQGERGSLEVANELDAARAAAEDLPTAKEVGDFDRLSAPTREELEAFYADYERATGPDREGGQVTEAERLAAAGETEGGAPPGAGPSGRPAEEGAPGTEYEQRAKQKQLGSYNPVTRLLRLGRDADASTFIHESGHQFLEQMKQDAAHPEAPAELRDDWDTTLRWLGVKSGEDIKRRHHEKFARGFEEYVLEGRAPSPALQDVFARFKEWLRGVYQTLKDLYGGRGESRLSPDIRRVFDRMFAEEPQRSVITEERERQPSMADIQEADAAETEPAQAAAVADQVAAERQSAVNEPPPGVRTDAIATAVQTVETAAAERGGEAGAGAEGGGEVGAGGAPAGTEPGGGGVREATTAVGAGGGAAATEGARVSGGTGSAARGGPSAEPPLSPRPIQRYGAEDSPYLDKAGNIRLELLTNEEDLRQAIRDAAARNNDFLGNRQGRVSDAEVSRLAEEMGFTGALSMAQQARIGRAYNSVEVEALRKAIIQSAGDVNAAMRAAGREGATDADILAFAEATERHRLIQGALSGATAEAGRALRAFRDMTGGAADEVARAAMGMTLFQLRTVAKLGSKLETPEAIGKFTQDMKKKSFVRMALEYWVNGLISGIATHTTYAVGNTILAVHSATLETGTAAAIGRIRRAMGRKGEVVEPGEVGAQLRGMVTGFVPGVHSAMEATRTGVTSMLPGETRRAMMPFQPGAELAEPGLFKPEATVGDVLASSYGVMQGMKDAFIANDALVEARAAGDVNLIGTEYSLQGHIPNIRVGDVMLPVGSAIRVPSRMVAAIHSFFRGINYTMDINAQAYRKATQEGLTGQPFDARVAQLRQNPTEEMMNGAHERANARTLMEGGSKFTQALSRLTNTEFLGGPWLKFIDPFVHISGNIINQSIIQRTPIGIFSPELRADLMGKNGTIAQDTAQAKMLVGTAFASLIGGLASQGLVSGGGPMDPREAAMWRLAGNQPHSIRVGDFWYDTHRLGVMGMLFSTGADLYDIADKASEGDLLAAGSRLLFATAHNILDESFARGPSEALRAIENHNGYRDVWLRNFAASFVPYSVLMSQTARAMDPYSREARDFIDSVKLKLPFKSTELLPRYDIWGQEIPNREVLLGASGLLAIYAEKVNNDPVTLAMLQLGKFPAPVERKIRGVELTGEQHAEYARMAGRMAKSRLDVIVNSPDWQQMSPEARNAVVDIQIRQSREVAANYIMAKDPTIPGRAIMQKREKFQEKVQHGTQYQPQ